MDNGKIEWKFFPANQKNDRNLEKIICIVKKNFSAISSRKFQKESNDVLKILSQDFRDAGYFVESGKKEAERNKIEIKNKNNNTIKKFFPDILSIDGKTIVEVESGRGIENYQFLKDFFEASVCDTVENLVIIVRQNYKKAKHYKRIVNFFECASVSNKFTFFLQNILIIGY